MTQLLAYSEAMRRLGQKNRVSRRFSQSRRVTVHRQDAVPGGHLVKRDLTFRGNSPQATGAHASCRLNDTLASGSNGCARTTMLSTAFRQLDVIAELHRIERKHIFPRDLDFEELKIPLTRRMACGIGLHQRWGQHDGKRQSEGPQRAPIP